MTPAECRRPLRSVPGALVSTLRLAVTLAALPIALADTYLAVLTVAAALRARRPVDVEPSRSSPRHHLAVLVPAHDEEASIGTTIDSALTQDYPPELVTVHVVADNCTDATADVARRHGARVHERHNPAEPGKGPALGWLVDRIIASGDQVDGMLVIDADTSMAPDLLAAADTALAGLGSAWQAYYTVREPEQAPAAALRHAALALRHYVRPLGRRAIGASCGLFGNGMLFRADLLEQRRFSAHLTEDVEFQLQLLLDGQPVTFVPEMVVEAEMPTTFAASRTQNERWELGRVQLARRFVPQLVRRAIRPGGGSRVPYVDAALDQLVPPLSVLAVGTSAVAAGAAVLRGRRRSLLTVLAPIGLVCFLVHVAGGLRLARVPRETYRALLHAPRLVVWKVVLWTRVLLRPEKVRWTRTARNKPVVVAERSST
jgi:1,2-diacylglycerol 3-beta-glucosyltransferase